MMALIGAKLTRVEPGIVDVELPFSVSLTQHNGFLHGGTVATLGDTAAGYAAFSLIPADSDILTVEFKINYLAPAIGDRVVAQGRVIRNGRTLIVSQADLFAIEGEDRKLVATMIATMMCMHGKS